MTDNRTISPGEVYALAVKTLPAKDIDHHNSDLYLRFTPEATELLRRLDNKSLLTRFQDQDGEIWYELPFCFTPFWQSHDRSVFY